MCGESLINIPWTHESNTAFHTAMSLNAKWYGETVALSWVADLEFNRKTRSF